MSQERLGGARLVEMSSGLLAGVLGVGWLGSQLLFGIPGVRASVNPSGGPSLVEVTRPPLHSFGLLPVLAVVLLLLASVGVAWGSYQHGQRGQRESLALLWVASLLLLVGAAFLIFGLGIVLAVAALLALLASLTGTWAELRRAR